MADFKINAKDSASVDHVGAAFVLLIRETLFYDEEYGVGGNLSLVDQKGGKEMYISAYLPETGEFVIEKATEWEDYEADEDDEIGYALAVDSEDYGTYQDPDAVAHELARLIQDEALSPSITLRFEEDDED
jgi:hypothetical protein